MENTCPWAVKPGIMKDYHDREWGVPVYDDRTLFEFILLESAQAGLSWLTILKKRENYRLAFAGFDPEIVSLLSEKDVTILLENAGIIRNRRKINAAISNAKAFLEIASEYGSFSEYIWRFTYGKPIVHSYESISQVPPKTNLSARISRDMKERGFSFFGPVICYSHMQATGMVNDHLVSCRRHKEIIDDMAEHS